MDACGWKVVCTSVALLGLGACWPFEDEEERDDDPPSAPAPAPSPAETGEPDSAAEDTGTAPVDADGDGYTSSEDCDDADPSVLDDGESALVGDGLTMSFQYCYYGSDCDPATWNLWPDGAWSNGSPIFGDGTWSFVCATSTFEALYENGTRYVGTTTDRETFEGYFYLASGEELGTWWGLLR